ncbi:MAG: patatin-like phospholipase family protein [Eubacteriales bacterium]
MKKKVGLALGAGSAKGFAHIGVLQALDEAGIQIDMIAGSSMGAIIGGIYSVGTDLNMLRSSSSPSSSMTIWM